MSSPLVELRGIAKTYGTHQAATQVLRGIDLEIPAGQLVSVMGPSGCGKTTLLNLMAGLDTPTEGSIRVAGHRLESMDETERSGLRLGTIGLVFQNFNLMPRISVERNVAWRLELAGRSPREAQIEARELLHRLDVPALAWSRYPAKLSGGEQQRVAIARALATNPPLLLADEPTGNLDSATGRSILSLLRELNAERQMTIVMVTHDESAASETDRRIELRDGVILRDARLSLQAERVATS